MQQRKDRVRPKHYKVFNSDEWRHCKGCDDVLLLNSKNFSKKNDGFQYTCKLCAKDKVLKSRRDKQKLKMEKFIKGEL